MQNESYPFHPAVQPSRVFQVQQDSVEGPGEGQVHGGVMRGMALQCHVLPLVDISVGRSQGDLSGICVIDRHK